MSTVTPPAVSPRRHFWRWVLLRVGLCLTPFVALALVAVSYVTLDHDEAVLRREVMAATDANWHTKVQVSVGWATLGLVRTGLRFIQAEHMDEARLALKAVRSASVGVYESNVRNTNIGSSQHLQKTDLLMQRRGWTRLVGAVDGDQTVLIYTSNDIGDSSRIDLCVAVVNGRELVIVSTKVDAGALMKLAEMKMPEGGFRAKLRQVKLNF